MSTHSITSHLDRTLLTGELSFDASIIRIIEHLEHSLGIGLSLVDGTSGELLRTAPEQAQLDWSSLSEVCREVARRKQPEFIEEEGPLLVLAIPTQLPGDRTLVAVGAFVSRYPEPHDDLGRAPRLLGMDADETRDWMRSQASISAPALLRLADASLASLNAQRRTSQLESEMDDLSLHLSTTYEEISLLYRLTQNLKLSSKDEELADLAVHWLADVLPVESLAVHLVARTDSGNVTRESRTEAVMIAHGPCPVDAQGFAQLIAQIKPEVARRPTVINQIVTSDAAWPSPGIRQMILVPLCEGNNLFGWIAAFNHPHGAEFGTPEASLISSVATILGIHSGNVELYRRQAEFVAGLVRALTAAIDAKDPYTCGHSDRVARVAVRLGEEMGCCMEQLNTIYLSGLLHDVGKIGIDDNVLRKPGMLTPAEYEHIKTHTEIGHRILQDIKQLDEVLPVVLHHHEQWDGRGYPHRLTGEQTPLLARIVAVADAFDAMGSDRPYRKGMPEEKLDSILRAGAGKQWDPEVIDAFFRARDAIRDISHRERANLTLDVQQWI